VHRKDICSDTKILEVRKERGIAESIVTPGGSVGIVCLASGLLILPSPYGSTSTYVSPTEVGHQKRQTGEPLRGGVQVTKRGQGHAGTTFELILDGLDEIFSTPIGIVIDMTTCPSIDDKYPQGRSHSNITSKEPTPAILDMLSQDGAARGKVIDPERISGHPPNPTSRVAELRIQGGKNRFPFIFLEKLPTVANTVWLERVLAEKRHMGLSAGEVLSEIVGMRAIHKLHDNMVATLFGIALISHGMKNRVTPLLGMNPRILRHIGANDRSGCSVQSPAQAVLQDIDHLSLAEWYWRGFGVVFVIAEWYL